MVDTPYTYAYTSSPPETSTILRSDGAEFPQDPGNADYQAWLAWEDAGGITTPAADPSLDDRKDAAKLIVDAQASDATRAVTSGYARDSMAGMLRFQEARDYEADLTPDNADYPMLSAEVPGTAATVDLVHDAVLAENVALRGSLGDVEEVRQTAYTDIDACTDQAGIDAVLAALDWTP